MKLIDWFPTVAGHRFVPLFDASGDCIVRTKTHGKDSRKLLCRSSSMERAVIDCVEQGLKGTTWSGLLYVMGWGTGQTFRPLYAGKAERKGKEKALSSNIASIRKNFGKFARWGDGTDYHIGELSHVVFGFTVYKKPAKKYKRWATALFDSFDPPRLKEPVYLYLAPWGVGCTGPSGLVGSLPSVEKEVIALASVQFPDSLLNVDGV